MMTSILARLHCMETFQHRCTLAVLDTSIRIHIIRLRQFPSEQHTTFKLKLSPVRALLFLLITLAATYTFSMTSIFQRLTRPFTSSTMRFAPDQAAQMTVPEGAQKCTLAAGCFWGVEHMYRKDFSKKGLLDARVGYIGGDTENPSYRAVCSGRTGREYCLRRWEIEEAIANNSRQTPKRSK